MLPTNDYVFRRIFGHVGNERITAGLIGSIINQEIKKIKINEKRITEQDMKDDKVGVLDLKARLNNEIICNVEMQVVQQQDIDKRIMFYWGKIYTEEIKEKQKYSVLPKTIVILIANFKLKNLKEIPKYHTKWQIREEEYRKILLTNTLELHIIELPKLIKHLEENKEWKRDKVALWSMFILNPENVGEEEMKENEDLKLAKEELEKIKQDEHDRYMAELRMKHIRDMNGIKEFAYNEGREEGREDGMQEGKKIGIQQGIQQGMQEGKRKEKESTAKKLKKLKMPIEQIMEITELTEEEIKNI